MGKKNQKMPTDFMRLFVDLRQIFSFVTAYWDRKDRSLPVDDDYFTYHGHSDGMQHGKFNRNPHHYVVSRVLITARKRSLRSLCFYTSLSVILLHGGGVPGQVPPQGRYTPLGRYTPRAGNPPRAGKPPPGRYTPQQCMLGYGQQAGVRILLECFPCLCVIVDQIFLGISDLKHFVFANGSSIQV